jgi:hypothetical protein
MVTRAEFEAELLGDGTKSARAVLSRTWIVWRTTMTLYGRVVVLDGSATLVFDDRLCSDCPGDFCSIRAGGMHENHTQSDGVCYVFGRRMAAAVAAQ